MSEPYHRFVFDVERRRFVGDFEAMYAAEEREGFDSWHQEDDHLARRVALAVLAPYGFRRILDFGCGKGVLGTMLKTEENDVLGVDISPTAIEKARARDARCRWRVLGRDGLDEVNERFDLALAAEVLSYLEDWRSVLAKLAARARYLWITLYLPPDPIGFVKSFDELRAAVGDVGTTEHELMLDGEQLCMLVRSRRNSLLH